MLNFLPGDIIYIDITVGVMPAKNTTYVPTLTFEAARQLAGAGYVNPTLLAELTSSWFFVGQPRLTDLPDFFGPFFAAIALSRPERVLDFGGATGRYRAYVDSFFGHTIRPAWHVVETALYADYAIKHPVAGVTVHTMISDVPVQPDMVIFSGSLQYVSNWQEIIDHPMIRAAETIYIVRTPLGDVELPFLQIVEYDAGTLETACRVIAKSDLANHLSKTHYLFSSFPLPQYVGQLGTFDAPAMIWRKRQ